MCLLYKNNICLFLPAVIEFQTAEWGVWNTAVYFAGIETGRRCGGTRKRGRGRDLGACPAQLAAPVPDGFVSVTPHQILHQRSPVISCLYSCCHISLSSPSLSVSNALFCISVLPPSSENSCTKFLHVLPKEY